jgi:uncharacterized membrane protein
MQTQKPGPIPLKFQIALLRLYIFMGVVSMLAGGYLSNMAYEMRIAGNRLHVPTHGAIYVMIVGIVIITFGVWRCLLASYHLYRLRGRNGGRKDTRAGV